MYHTLPTMPQRSGAQSAATHLLRGLMPHRPDPAWDGRLWLRALPRDLPFEPPKAAKKNRRPNGPLLTPSIQDGRGLIFCTDQSAVAVRQEGERWRVLPTAVSLTSQLFSADDQRMPISARTGADLRLRAVGARRIASIEGGDSALLEAYPTALFGAIDALWDDPRWALPVGDMRLLDPWAQDLPTDRAYPSWANLGGPSEGDKAMLTHLLSLLARHLHGLLCRASPEAHQGTLSLSVTFQPTPPARLGAVGVSIHFHAPWGLRANGGHPNLARILDPWRAYMKAWFKGPQFWIPYTQRHPQAPLRCSHTSGHQQPATAHQVLDNTARLRAILADAPTIEA